MQTALTALEKKNDLLLKTGTDCVIQSLVLTLAQAAHAVPASFGLFHGLRDSFWKPDEIIGPIFGNQMKSLGRNIELPRFPPQPTTVNRECLICLPSYANESVLMELVCDTAKTCECGFFVCTRIHMYI